MPDKKITALRWLLRLAGDDNSQEVREAVSVLRAWINGCTSVEWLPMAEEAPNSFQTMREQRDALFVLLVKSAPNGAWKSLYYPNGAPVEPPGLFLAGVRLLNGHLTLRLPITYMPFLDCETLQRAPETPDADLTTERILALLNDNVVSCLPY